MDIVRPDVTIDVKTGVPPSLAVAAANQSSNRSVLPLHGDVAHRADYNRVLKKTLRADVFSHIEERDECLSLEYTPYSVESPVDMRYPLRLTRMGRNVRLVFGIVVPACAPREMLEHSYHAVATNVWELTAAGWDWTNIAVVIVFDGVEFISRTMVDYLHNTLRLFEPTMMSRNVKGERIHMHVYERTVEIAKHAQAREYYNPLQTILALSSHQCGDMKSYMWLFNAFCQQLQPEYVLAMTVGAVPQKHCTTELLDSFAAQPATVVLFPDAHIASSSIFHPLIMSQLFFTKMYSALYAPCNSLFGYVPTGPSVCATTGIKHCAAFRWPGVPSAALGRFFEGQVTPIATLGPVASLRQMTPLDIIAWQVFDSDTLVGVKKVSFEPRASVHVQLPESFLSFMDQQRIDYSGYMFNTMHYLINAPRAMIFGRRDVVHSTPGSAACALFQRFLRLPFYLLQYLMIFANMFGSWFTVAASYMMLQYLTDHALLQSRFQLANGVKYAFKFVFVLLVFSQVVAALGMELKQMKLLYVTMGCVHGFIFLSMLAMVVWLVVSGSVHPWLAYAAGGCIALHLVLFVLTNKIYSVVKTAVHVLLLLPVYWIMIPVHAVATCNNIAVHKRYLPRPHEQEANDDVDPVPAMFVGSPTFASGRYPKSLDAVDKDIIDYPWDIADVHNLLTIKPPSLFGYDRAKLATVRRQFAAFRTRTLMLWLATNWLAVSFMLYFNFLRYFPWGLVAFGVFVSVTRCGCALLFFLLRWTRSLRHLCCPCCRPSASTAPTSSQHGASLKAAPSMVPSNARKAQGRELNVTSSDSVGDQEQHRHNGSRRDMSSHRDRSRREVSAHERSERNIHIGQEMREAEATTAHVHSTTAEAHMVAQFARGHLDHAGSHRSRLGAIAETPSGAMGGRFEPKHANSGANLHAGGRGSASPLLQSSDDEGMAPMQLPHVVGASGAAAPGMLMALASQQPSLRGLRGQGFETAQQLEQHLGIRHAGSVKRRMMLPLGEDNTAASHSPTLHALSPVSAAMQMPVHSPLSCGEDSEERSPFPSPAHTRSTDMAFAEPTVRLSPAIAKSSSRKAAEFRTPSAIPVTLQATPSALSREFRSAHTHGMPFGEGDAPMAPVPSVHLDAALMQAADAALFNAAMTPTGVSVASALHNPLEPAMSFRGAARPQLQPAGGPNLGTRPPPSQRNLISGASLQQRSFQMRHTGV